MLYEVFGFFRRRVLVRNQCFRTTCLSHLQGLEVNQEPTFRDYLSVPSSGSWGERGTNVSGLLVRPIFRVSRWTRNQRFRTTCLSHLQGLEENQEPTFQDYLSVPSSGSWGEPGKAHLETLMIGQTTSPETLVSYQKTKPGKNSKDFIQQDITLHLRK
jgi:hypothetical protein